MWEVITHIVDMEIFSAQYVCMWKKSYACITIALC